jgi:Rrf2 family iron-sulfur cluster assembly transcriptional regulator
MAEKDAPGPVLVREIAQASGTPHQSLAKILHSLRNQGLVRSTKGPGGGYRLARPGEAIRLTEVIEAVDGPIEVNKSCILGLDQCTDLASCALHDVWTTFRERYYATIANMTLRDAAHALRHKRVAIRDFTARSIAGG